MAETVLSRIEEISHERERLLAKEGSHHSDTGERARLQEIDHELQVLWDLRRRELAGETVDLQQDYYDRYDRYMGRGPSR